MWQPLVEFVSWLQHSSKDGKCRFGADPDGASIRNPAGLFPPLHFRVACLLQESHRPCRLERIICGARSPYSSGMLARLIQTVRKPNFVAPATSHLFEDWNETASG